MMPLLVWLFIGVAGGIGAVCRACLDAAVTRASRPNWPAGIFTVNVVGCFLLGLITNWLIVTGTVSQDVARMITVGFFGGFTTFSTAMVDVVQLLRNNRTHMAIAVFMGTFASGILALVAGHLAGTFLA